MVLLGMDAGATEPRPTDAFTSLFEQTCVRHRDAPPALAAQLAQWGAAALPAQEARRYLGDGQGTVWALQRQTVRYAVALQGNGVCTVTAPRIDAKAVKRNFPLLALDSPAPFASRRIDGTVAASAQDPTTRMVYAWTAPDTNRAWRLSLTLSNGPQQAAASMTRVAASP